MGILDIADRIVNGRDAHVEAWTVPSDRERLIALRLEIYEQSRIGRGVTGPTKTHEFQDPALRRIAHLTGCNTRLHHMSSTDQTDEAERLARFADRLDRSIAAGLVKDDPESVNRIHDFEMSLSLTAGAMRGGRGKRGGADDYIGLEGMMSPEREKATYQSMLSMSPNALELIKHGVFEAVPPRNLRPIAAALRDDPRAEDGASDRSGVRAEGPAQTPAMMPHGRGDVGR